MRLMITRPRMRVFLSDIGAARLFQQRDLTPAAFAVTLAELLDRKTLQQMAEKARTLAKPDATALVVNAILRGHA